MSAKVLQFGRCLGAPMSQVLPLPRVDINGPVGDWPDHEYRVELVRNEGKGGIEILATFTCGSEAEAWAEKHHRDLFVGGVD